jgi:hypothetical protein
LNLVRKFPASATVLLEGVFAFFLVTDLHFDRRAATRLPPCGVSGPLGVGLTASGEDHVVKEEKECDKFAEFFVGGVFDKAGGTCRAAALSSLRTTASTPFEPA